MKLPKGKFFNTSLGMGFKNRSRVETQPRCKIQYPMKNHNKDEGKKLKRGGIDEKYFQHE